MTVGMRKTYRSIFGGDSSLLATGDCELAEVPGAVTAVALVSDVSLCSRYYDLPSAVAAVHSETVSTGVDADGGSFVDEVDVAVATISTARTHVNHSRIPDSGIRARSTVVIRVRLRNQNTVLRDAADGVPGL